MALTQDTSLLSSKSSTQSLIIPGLIFAAILASMDKRIKKIICLAPVVDWVIENKFDPLDNLYHFIKKTIPPKNRFWTIPVFCRLFSIFFLLFSKKERNNKERKKKKENKTFFCCFVFSIHVFFCPKKSAFFENQFICPQSIFSLKPSL